MLAPIVTDPWFYLFAIPAVIFLGLAKGGFSGAATAATPLLALYLPPLEAAALLLPLVLCQDAISLQVYWRERSARNLKVLLPGAVFGVTLGWLFAAHVSDDVIRILVGITALAFIANVWMHGRPTKHAFFRPFTLRAEFHIADHGLECGLAHIFGKLIVIKALRCGDRLAEHLQVGVGPHRHVVTKRVSTGRGGAFLDMPAAKAEDPIKIGFGMALTGPLAANGKMSLVAMQVWLPPRPPNICS
jgi:hypothetical protein